jgi:hypothetical protein
MRSNFSTERKSFNTNLENVYAAGGRSCDSSHYPIRVQYLYHVTRFYPVRVQYLYLVTRLFAREIRHSKYSYQRWNSTSDNISLNIPQTHLNFGPATCIPITNLNSMVNYYVHAHNIRIWDKCFSPPIEVNACTRPIVANSRFIAEVRGICQEFCIALNCCLLTYSHFQTVDLVNLWS